MNKNPVEKELVVAADQPAGGSVSIFANEKSFVFAQRAAQALASSELVPERYQSAKNGTQAVSNAMIAMDMANRVGMNPLMVMQNLYVVYGNPGWSAQYIRAAINSSGKFSIPQYEYTGEEGKDNYTCRCYATYLANGEKIFGPKVSIAMAKAEGWWGKKGSKWPNMTDLMLSNRAVTFFGRTYCPEVLMGMQSSDELVDIHDVNPIPGQEPMTKTDIKDAIVGDAVDVSRETDDKPPEEKPVTAKKPAEEEKPAAEAKKKDEPDKSKKNDSSADGPVFTADGLVGDIEAAETIDYVNEALSCTKGFSQSDQKKVMRAASAKNKELAAKRGQS